MQLVAWLHEQTGLENLVFAGGCGLNCTANGEIMRTSASAACSSRRARTTAAPPSDAPSTGSRNAWGSGRASAGSTTSSAPTQIPAAIEAAVDAVRDEFDVERPDDLAAAMVDLLATGRVVALHQGRSESGPRALGNRSIIGDARRPEMQDYINFEVKGREWFRPLAPLVLADPPSRSSTSIGRRRSCSTRPTCGRSTARSTRASRTSTAPPGCRPSSRRTPRSSTPCWPRGTSGPARRSCSTPR